MNDQTTQQAPHATGMQHCITECLSCHQICLETIGFCLRTGGEHAAEPHIVLLLDCAQICAVSADFMLRGSQHQVHLCRECAEICTRCAEECNRLGGHEEMRRCAEACRRCAENNQKVAGSA